MKMPNLPQHDPLSTRYSLLSRLHDWDDQDSWREFFETYWGLIFSIATRSGLNETEAADVVQETVICVARDIQKFKRDRTLGSFRGWLRNIIRWCIADYLKKQTRGRLHADEAESAATLEELAIDTEAVWDQEWQTQIFEAAVGRVKQKVKAEQYQMFDLYAVQQLPVTEVARRLKVSIGHIYVAKHRIAALIKKEVKLLEDGLY